MRLALVAIAPLAVALLVIAALAATGCGEDRAGSSRKPRLVVSAAASMTDALRSCAPRFRGADVRLSFAGSDQLAAQIRQGIRPDVYAAANAALPDQLHEEGLLDKPVRFATNRLVVALPAHSRILSLNALRGGGVALAIGSRSVPIGAYTRTVLSRLPAGTARAILANVRSSEPDVKGIVGKLVQHAADAGFVYESDVRAAGGRLKSLPLPARLQPTVVFAAAVVRGTRRRGAARRFVAGLAKGGCRAALTRAGFGALP